MENVIINDFNRLIDELNKLTKNDSIFRGYSHEDEMFPNILRRENLPSEEIMLIYERKLLENLKSMPYHMFRQIMRLIFYRVHSIMACRHDC